MSYGPFGRSRMHTSSYPGAAQVAARLTSRNHLGRFVAIAVFAMIDRASSTAAHGRAIGRHVKPH